MGDRRTSLWGPRSGHESGCQDQLRREEAIAVCYKQQCAALWSGCSHTYVSPSAALLAPLHQQIARLCGQIMGKRSSVKVLEIAAGGGDLSCMVAADLPHVNVVTTDLAPGMMDQTRKLALRLGLANVSAMVADGEDLSAFADGSVDALLCCCGLMFFPCHDRALREFRRVLSPGGVLIVAVTGSRDLMQISDLVDPIMRALPAEAQPVCVANPRPFGSVARLLRSMHRTGFRSVLHRECNVPMRIAPDAVSEFVLSNPTLGEAASRLDAKVAAAMVQAAQVEVLKAAQAWQYLQQDGSIVLSTNMHTIITARTR